MPLQRITLATETLQDFVALTPAKQRIVIFLLSRRNMKDKPICPTNYFSYADIADETQLKADTVRVLILSLQKEGWLTRENQRVQFTPAGKAIKQFRWCMTKVKFQIEQTYEDEDDEQAMIDIGENPDYFLFEDKIWRAAGALGWQSRKQNALNGGWTDTSTPPDAVIDFFS